MRSAPRIPVVEVDVGNAPMDARALESLSELRVQRKLSQPAMCEMVFLGGAGGGLGIGPRAAVRVRANHETLFSGDVTAVEYVYGANGSREFHVRGYDQLHRLRKRQTVRSYSDVRLDDLARALTASEGLTVSGPAGLPLLRSAIQWRDSDFDFLARIAARWGIYFWLQGDTLHLASLAGEGEPVVLDLGRNLLRAHFERNCDASCSQVRASAWDPSFARGFSGTAGAPTGQAGERILLNRIAESDADAQMCAQGEMDRRAGRELTLIGTVEGDAKLGPGSRARVAGADSALCGTYALTAVIHRIDTAGGFVSEISTEPPAGVEPSAPATVSLGIVTDVEDPENLGRVRVKFTAYEDAESGWLAVATAGAGAGKGIIATPDVGDTVMLLEPGGDPAHALVVGGLYGSVRPPDAGIVNGRSRRFSIHTTAPHKLTFDDANRTIRLEDATTNHIELSPKEFVLHAATDLRIEAPGRKIKILADEIDFERG